MRRENRNNARTSFYCNCANQRGSVVLEEASAHSEIVGNASAIPKLANVKKVIAKPYEQ